MALTVLFTSNLALMISAHKQIGKSALTAAAEVVRQWAEEYTLGGFETSSGNIPGRFVTPDLGLHINKDVDWGNNIAHIGTDIQHGKFWENGHNNVITGSYERDPWLTKAINQTQKEQDKAAQKAAQKVGNKFLAIAGERLLGLTPIGPLRSAIGR